MGSKRYSGTGDGKVENIPTGDIPLNMFLSGGGGSRTKTDPERMWFQLNVLIEASDVVGKPIYAATTFTDIVDDVPGKHSFSFDLSGANRTQMTAERLAMLRQHLAASQKHEAARENGHS